jgi:hypothetical protein
VFVIDANVAIHAFVDDPLRPAASRILSDDARWRVPDIFLGECANALARLVRVRRMSEDFAKETLQVISDAAGEPIASLGLVPAAFNRAFALNHGVFDCLYLETARASGARLITADRRFVEKLRGTSDEGLILHLSDRRH